MSKDWVIRMGYRMNNFHLFGMGGKRKAVKSKGKGSADKQKNSSNASSNRNSYGTNHDLNCAWIFSFRKQAAIVRDIASMMSSASSGNNEIEVELLCRLYVEQDAHHEFLLRSSDEYASAFKQQLSDDDTRLRSEHQVLLDEIDFFFIGLFLYRTSRMNRKSILLIGLLTDFRGYLAVANGWRPKSGATKKAPMKNPDE